MHNAAEPSKDIRVFPNPARNELNIEYAGSSEVLISIRNLNGGVIQTYPYNHGPIDISFLEPGVYLLTASSVDFFRVEKLVIVR